MINQETMTTLVKVVLTDVKYFDESQNKVEVTRLMGKASIPQCREYVKSLNSSNIYITKENVIEQLQVNTMALYSLKQGN